MSTEKENRRNIELFLELVKKYPDVSELTGEIVRVFIEKIVFHQANGRQGKYRRQQIDVYWNFVGMVGAAETDESEEK